MKQLLLVALFLQTISSYAQTNLEEIQPSSDYDNILVQKITTDQHASCFLIWIKDSVRAHKHEHHTENLYVISGNGHMKLNNNSIPISSGDFITIPQGTIHSVKVISENPLKVLSVQAPEFLGKDRVFIE